MSATPLTMSLLVIVGLFSSVARVSTTTINTATATFTPETLTLGSSQAVTVNLNLSASDQISVPLSTDPFNFTLNVVNGTALQGVHFTADIPTLEVTPTTEINFLNVTFEVTIILLADISTEINFTLVPADINTSPHFIMYVSNPQLPVSLVAPPVPNGVLEFVQSHCSSLMMSWPTTSLNITHANINYNRVSDANVVMVTYSLSGNPSDVALSFTESGSFEFQIQLVSSDGRSGNFSLQSIECSGADTITKSIMTVVMCVAMAIMAAIH